MQVCEKKSAAQEIVIICDSLTGNTKKVCAALEEKLLGLGKRVQHVSIKEALGCESYLVPEMQPGNSSRQKVLLILGSWVKRSGFSPKIMQLLKERAQEFAACDIALVATAGFVGGPYPSKILSTMKEQLAEHDLQDNFVGYFVCQGKMPVSTRERYLSGTDRHASTPEMIAFKIRNWEEALRHPSEADLMAAKEFIAGITQEDLEL